MSEETAVGVRIARDVEDDIDFDEVVSPGPAAAPPPQPAPAPPRKTTPAQGKEGHRGDPFLTFCSLVRQYALRLRTIAGSGGTARAQAEELTSLVGTADQIFQLEERLMRLTGIRGQKAHLADHAALRKALDQLIERLSQPKVAADWHLPGVLERWVERHQQLYDGPLENHLKVIALLRGAPKTDRSDDETGKGSGRS